MTDLLSEARYANALLRSAVADPDTHYGSDSPTSPAITAARQHAHAIRIALNQKVAMLEVLREEAAFLDRLLYTDTYTDAGVEPIVTLIGRLQTRMERL